MPPWRLPSTRARARAREAAGNQRPWPADKVERWAIDRLIPYAKNARTHTDAQVAAIAASIKEWGWTTPALVGEDGGLIAGHARILAARQLGIAEIPVMVAAGWTEAQKRAYVLADNQLAITGSGWDHRPGSPDQVSLVAMGENGLKRTDEDELCAIQLRNRLERRPSDPDAIRRLILAGGEVGRFHDPSRPYLHPEDVEIALDIDPIRRSRSTEVGL